MRGAALALLLLVAGCGPVGTPLSVYSEPEYLRVPLQPTRERYATIRTIVGNRINYARALCRAGKITQDVCAVIETDIETIVALDFEVMRALQNPQAVLDVDKIMRILEISAKLIGLFA